MPSFLNPHPFRTSTTPKKSPPQQPPKLSSAHIDLWEHAALLYHHFEWHSAIETFQHLFHTLPTSSAEARTRCLLNAGIIQARLGDYALAAQTLEDAARTDAEFVLTPSLLGIVEWELGNLIKAEACLEISLVALRRYRGEGEVGVQRYGVGFMLREEVVRELLERLRGVDPLSERAQSTIVGFAVLEAEYIFEAPAREDGLEDVSVWRREEEVISTGKTSISRQPEHLSDSSPKLAVKNPRETLQELKSFLRGHKPIPSPNPIVRVLPPPDPPNSHPSHPPTATAEATYHSTWRRRPPTPYIPRDARGEYHSVGELVRFIRRYQNQLGPMAPRDPRGEAESTGELARFIRCAGREGGEVVAGLRMPFLDGEETGGLVAAGEVESLLDLYLVREDVGDIIVGGGGGGGGGGNGGETGGGGGGIARRYSDPIPAHTATTDVTGGMERQILTDPNTPTSSHFPSSSFKDDENSASDETIRLLLPKVYEGTPTMTNNIPSLQLLDLSPPRHPTEQEDNPLANFHTAGSETSSLFRQSMLTIERAQVARSEALRRLEGRARVDMKPLRMGVRRGVGAGRGGKRQREGGEEGMGRAERLRNGRTDEGRGEGNGGSVPTIISTAPPTAVVGTVDPVPNLLNGKLDGKGIAAPTKTTTTKGKAKFLLPSHSKPLPPGPPLGKAGRFEVFLTDGYLDRSPLLGKAGRFEVFLGDEYPDRREDGVKAGNAGVGGDEEKEEEGNAVRVPSSKIFEYMSRG